MAHMQIGLNTPQLYRRYVDNVSPYWIMNQMSS